MLTVRRATSRHCVARRLQVLAGADRDIIGRAQTPQGETHPVQGGLTVNKREALGEHHLERQANHAVEHARRGADRIVLDRYGRAEDFGGMATCRELHGIKAKCQASISERVSDVIRRNQKRPYLSVHQAGEKRTGFRAETVFAGVSCQKAGAIRGQGRQKGFPCGVELADFLLENSGAFRRGTEQAFSESHIALQRPAHQRQEQFVHKQPSFGELGTP